MSTTTTAATSAPTASAAAQQFIEFVNKSPTPFHATEECAKILEKAGFQRISESSEWKLQAGGRYFLTRNRSTIVAFAVGAKYVPGNGFHIVAGHTDSPCLKLKPVSAVKKGGFLGVGVQCYGGGLWHTWFDRDLGVAGRVIVAAEGGGAFEHRLVHINRPLLRIPTLAIHLDRDVNEALKFNRETQFVPVLATSAKAALEGGGEETTGGHHTVLIKALAAEMGVEPAAIRDFELCLFDTQPSTVGGVANEFIFSARLDNLVSTFAAVQALAASSGDAASLAAESGIRMAAAFDNEEVGSESAYGASSSMMRTVLNRITQSLAAAAGKSDSQDLAEVALARSFMISADMAHALHPNFGEKHEPNHAPAIHGGPVIKINANQRYATTAVTAFLVRELARRNGVPTQQFVVRNDSLCGSTIGPILSANCSVRVCDLGLPQLSMHSIREQMGCDDIAHGLVLFQAFYRDFTALDAQLSLGE